MRSGSSTAKSIRRSKAGPTTSGGNITIDPAVMTLQNSQILAQAVQGQGGNINIVAGTFLADPTSLVSASSQFGLSGAVNIQSPLSMLSGTLATLPKRPLQVQHLLQQRCAAQANGQLSSLVVAGRDTLPSEPGGWLMSSLALLIEDGLERTPTVELPSNRSVLHTESSQSSSRWTFVLSHQQLGRRLSLTADLSKLDTCTYPIRYGYQSASMRET